MGNIIFSTDIITAADAAITPRSESSGYSDENIMDHWHLKRRFRAADLTKSDTNPLLRIDMSAAKTVVAVVLEDCNFDKTRIKGHASDLTTNWAGASFGGTEVTVSAHPATGRYNIYIPLTGFNYRWLAVMTPAAASAVGSYVTYWEVGRVVILDSVIELTSNMDYGFSQRVMQQYADIKLPTGSPERIDLSGGVKQWMCRVVFGRRTAAEVSELFSVGGLDMSYPMVFYLNRGTSSEVAVCVKDGHVGATWRAYNIYEGADLDLVELV